MEILFHPFGRFFPKYFCIFKRVLYIYQIEILFQTFGRDLPSVLKYQNIQVLINIQIIFLKVFQPFGRDLPKSFYPKYFCILIISFKKVAEIGDSNDDDVESDKIFI